MLQGVFFNLKTKSAEERVSLRVVDYLQTFPFPERQIWGRPRLVVVQSNKGRHTSWWRAEHLARIKDWQGQNILERFPTNFYSM